MTLTNGQSFWTQHFSADEFGETQLKEGGIYFVLCEKLAKYIHYMYYIQYEKQYRFLKLCNMNNTSSVITEM